MNRYLLDKKLDEKNVGREEWEEDRTTQVARTYERVASR
jgi:hypothetical protein